MSSPDRVAVAEGQPSAGGGHALQGLIGIQGLQHSARLAGLSGGLMLILVALVAWMGSTPTRLDGYWVVWAAVPASIAAFGGPLLGRRLLGRRYLTHWRLMLLALMSVGSAAWAFASGVAVGTEPPSAPLLAIGWLGMSLALLPMLTWPAGLSMELVLQISCIGALLIFPDLDLKGLLLPLGLWLSSACLALMAAIYARRVDLARGDVYYMRFELSELQRQIGESQSLLKQAEAQRSTLESELAEILDLAEDASRAKTEFLATMSHEIRTPLNGILPILEMLRDTRLDEEQLKMVRTAQGSSRHLLRIINDILDFAKVESGKLQLETIEIDVRDLVDSVTELMSGSAHNHNLKVTASVAENVPQVVRGDPIRLRQILINLVSNAIKFTEEGGIRVEVSRGQSSQKEVELLFAVADTGVGMSAETADRLFQSFTQADASTTRKHGGTGLGLVICKRLVELMGGKIGIRSSVGQGSTFWFLVPLRKSVMEVPSARKSLKGIRVLTLITDDDIAARVSQNLRSWGVLEEPTNDPIEALSKLRSTAMLGKTWGYDLALIDGSGIEQRLPNLLAELRGEEMLKHTHIVVSVRSETLAHKLKHDFNVLVLAETLRTEPLRRVLHRLFDVESRRFGSADLRPEETYDDLNVSAADIALDSGPASPEVGLTAQVLLVEDNPVNLGVVHKALSKIGLECETAADGSEALARFRQQRFDLIFMDCQMPVMDGFEATRQIRRLEAAEGRVPTPIIAMTANAMAGDREKCIAEGMDDYLPKPVGLKQLRDCAARWLAAAPKPSRQEGAEAAARVERQQEPEDVRVLDQDVLRELREIMDDDYLSLLRTYLRNAPQLLEQARAAVARGDLAALVLPVHSLKSSSANVGAMHLSELAREAERAARAGDLDQAGVAFGAVDQAFGRAEAALREHLASQSAA